MLLTGIVFLIILSILVLVHEFGHFVVGKLAGIGVLEFALGLPFTKPLWSKKLPGGMKLSLYPLLFGGFVRLLGEDPPSSRQGGTSEGQEVKGRYFYQAKVWPRILVVVSGVAMNFLLAVAVFYLFLATAGFKVLIPRLSDYRFVSPSRDVVVVTETATGTPANQAGLVSGDVILSADGKEFTTLSDFQKYTRSRVGEPMSLWVTDLTFSRLRQVVVTPRRNPPAGQGPIGVRIGEGIFLSYQTPRSKMASGILYTGDMLFYNLATISHFIFSAVRTGNAGPLTESVSGPVGILGAVGTIVHLGGAEAMVNLLNLLGLLSLSLAFMNILPIPALDGGRLAFLLVEAFFGKKMAAEKENLVNQIGMAALLGLIVLISYNDIIKLIRR